MYIPDRAENRFQALLNGEMRYCFGKSAPSAPDYKGAAEAQAASGMEALRYQTNANRPDQNTPFGQTEWSKDKKGNWTQNTTLNKDSQRALDAQLGLSADRSELGRDLYDRVESEFADPMDWSGLPEIGGAAGARDRAEENLYNRSASRLDPQWEQRSSQMEAKLAAQGLRPGDKAYDQAMENMGRERTDAYDRATSSSIMSGGAEGERTFNMESKDRNRALAEQMQKRGFSLNEINALLSGQQVGMPDMPSFSNAGRGAATNYSGAAQSAGQYGLDKYSADQAMLNSAMSGASSMAMMSDRRLKRNITLIGLFKQYNFYLFQYVWGTWAVGVMSDEVNQDAVTRLPSGYDMVDLARVV